MTVVAASWAGGVHVFESTKRWARIERGHSRTFRYSTNLQWAKSNRHRLMALIDFITYDGAIKVILTLINLLFS
jgi:hypothetical protein